MDDLISGLKRAFTYKRENSTDVATLSPSRDETASEEELGQVLFIANGALSRARESSDYRRSAGRLHKELETSKMQLEEAIGKFRAYSALNWSARNAQYLLARSALAQIHTILGNYTEAESIYKSACSPISSKLPRYIPIHEMCYSNMTGGTRQDATEDDLLNPLFTLHGLKKEQVQITVEYFHFLATTGRDIDLAERLGKQLLAQAPPPY
ncbi:hypothetical protein BDV95DRAFT_582917 [Massariosphaeria phaeospora]|uniref:Uncharacterized protein n=1 Tax=Massariosphaeria phaeospora TaxID=100035 RepID=A0A7C8M4E2_9PLEO|nr:hypothetical protein BDV95DRAFT_582917 [Massariosphaeria phaeospora]